MDWAEACRVLGVSESAIETEIKEQYYYKAQLLHPDKNLDKPEAIRKKAEAELGLINQAYSFLNNPNNNPYKVPPKLEIEPLGIRFKDVKIGEKKSTTLRIKNVGGPYTSIWIDNQPAPWLTVTEVKSITTERLPLEVTLESTGIGEPGKQHSCNLMIKLENEKTHTVDTMTVKIELSTKNESVEEITSAKKSGISGSQHNIPTQAEQKNKLGFSMVTFLVNLLGFTVLGIVLYFLINIFFSLSEMVFMISLILYAVIAFGFSINHGVTIGSRTGKISIKSKKR